jgi:DNA-binding response OmpR family regulator
MPKLLLVEDDANISRLVARLLSDNGYDVDCVHDGRQALKYAAKGGYELVLLDLLIPELDGFAVLRGLMTERDQQQVIVLSSLSDVESKVKCFELGAIDYVAKPFVGAELLARVRARLRASSELGARYLRNGRYSLDLRRRVAIGNDTKVTLSSREFALLEHLMRREGEVCSREELLLDVWGFKFDPCTNVVDVYVGRLRNKLGSTVIETIRNVGYSYATS